MKDIFLTIIIFPFMAIAILSLSIVSLIEGAGE